LAVPATIYGCESLHVKAGAVLDADRYYIILPDNIGHGRSSKPSDGLRATFPNYRFADMLRTDFVHHTAMKVSPQ
jgi:pimeloyl-ACP methyl ester carboxylesterase